MTKKHVYLINVGGKYERLVTLQTLDNMIAKALAEWQDENNKDADKARVLYRALCREKIRILNK